MSDFIVYTNFSKPLRVQAKLGAGTFRVSPSFDINKVIISGGTSEAENEYARQLREIIGE